MTRCWDKKWSNFSKSCPKSSNSSFSSKWCFVKSPKDTKYLAYFCQKICHQELSKIAQSGHTEFITAAEVTFRWKSVGSGGTKWKVFQPLLLLSSVRYARKFIAETGTNTVKYFSLQIVIKILHHQPITHLKFIIHKITLGGWTRANVLHKCNQSVTMWW